MRRSSVRLCENVHGYVHDPPSPRMVRSDSWTVQCLLPLANTPLIEYTLEFLAKAGVQDVYVYCGAHMEMVEDYIRLVESEWAKTPIDELN